jgi:uncharacterized protein YcfJ
MRRRKIGILIMVGLITASVLAGCAYDPHRYRLQQGAGVGAVAGGIAGRLIGHDSAGMWLGATIGTIVGATVGNIMDQEREAVISASQQNKRVVIYNEKQSEAIEAIPGPANQQTNCKKVTTRHWKEGKLIQEETKEVCTGNKITNAY